MGSDNIFFFLIYSTIYADVGEWVGLKKYADVVVLEWSLTIQLRHFDLQMF